MKMYQTKKAFTLIELLVVISIIAVLLSILMPALRVAKQLATGSVCVSNQRNLIIAWSAYHSENNDTMVGGNNWAEDGWSFPPEDEDGDLNDPFTIEDCKRGIRRGLLWPYLRAEKVYHCPGDKRMNKKPEPAFESYSIAGGLNGEDTDISVEKFTKVRRPTDKYVFVERADIRNWNVGSFLANDVGSGSWIDVVAIWHNNQSTLSYADGHAKLHKWKDKDTIRMMKENQGLWGLPDPGSVDLLYMQEHYTRNGR